MIVAFMDAGYIVAADDHVGHGKTAIVNDSWGNWGSKGYETMREDEHIFMAMVVAFLLFKVRTSGLDNERKPVHKHRAYGRRKALSCYDTPYDLTDRVSCIIALPSIY